MPIPGAFVGGPFHALAFDANTFHVGLATNASITIDGVDVRARVRMAGLTIRDVLNDAPNTCTLTMEGDGPAVGQALRITLDDGLRVLFAGPIQTIDQSFESLPTLVAWNVTAIDDTAKANARRPFGTWVDTSATSIAVAITATYAPAFSIAGIENGLPNVSIVFDGSETLIACLARLATAVGGYCKVEDGIVYLFITDTAAAPDPIDADHLFLHTPPIQANTDSSQLRTRVYGKGYGETIRADLAAGETLFPIQDGVNFPPLGGDAIAGLTAEGAQSERLHFTGVELAGGGTLVGPGASPSTAPVVAVAGGAGVTTGAHTLSVVFKTAAGKTLAGPAATIDVGTLAPPSSAPTAGTALAGTGPDQGSHDYAASFVAAYGETIPSPISNAIATSAALGQVASPGFLNGSSSPLVAGNLTLAYPNFFAYRSTFVNATGETEGGYPVVVYAPPAPAPATYPNLGLTTGGSLVPFGWYMYWVSYLYASGYETAITNGKREYLNYAHLNAINVTIPVSPDARVVKRRLYRSVVYDAFTAPDPHSGNLVVEITNNTSEQIFFDTVADRTAGEVYWEPAFGSPSGPRGTLPGYQVHVTDIQTGPAGVTARKLYRATNATHDAAFHFLATVGNNTATTYDDNIANNDANADMPVSNTTGTAVQRIPVTNIPLGPAGVTARKLYRRFNGAGPFKLVTTLGNNTATTYTDAIVNSALGAAALAVATAIGNQLAVTLATGASAVTAREIYMSPVGSATRRLVVTVNDNVTTAVTITASDATIAGGALEPIADTSGLQQPNGQVNPGAIVLPVAASATFRSGGGWVTLAGGQTVRYTAISGQTLTGIPPTGPGAITTTVLYGSQALPAPMLVGVTGLTVPMLKGSAVHIWIQRDDLLAQAEQAARDGSDGVVEYLITDNRRTVESLTARCDADLAMFSRPIVTVAYATRDAKSKSGKPITITLDAPRIAETLTIQEVTITEIDLVAGLPPRFTVRASSVRFSLEDTLRRLIAGGSTVAGRS